MSNLESEGCCYLTFRLAYDKKDAFLETLCRMLAEQGIEPESLVGKSEAPIFDKYDDCIPTELLREGYAIDRLSPDEVLEVFLPDAERQRKERSHT